MALALLHQVARSYTSGSELMLANLHVKSLVAAGGLALAAWGMGGSANAADPFTLTSTTFKDGTLMPRKVANKNPQKSQLRRRQRVTAAVVVGRARGHQELRFHNG
jgi:hypothetical protein